MPRPLTLAAFAAFAAFAALVCACQGGAAPPPDPDPGPPSAGAAGNGRDEPGEGDPGPAETPPPSSGEPFALGEGEETTLDGGLVVRFVRVVGDSRCPEDVDCVWEGDAEIEVELRRSGEAATVRLHTNPGFATRATALGHAVELVELHPYPKTEADKSGDYRATLRVTADG